MAPEQIETLRREIQTMRQESVSEHRELRREMQSGFQRLEKILSKHDERIRALEIERGKLAGIALVVGSLFGALSGWLVDLMRGGR